MDQNIIVARCHEIKIMASNTEVAQFDSLEVIGSAVRLALHIRDLPIVEFETLRLVSSVMLGIRPSLLREILYLLADINFVRLSTSGSSIKTVLPTVPFYEDLYAGIGEFMTNERPLDSFEKLTVDIVNRLAGAPSNADALANEVGALGGDRKTFDESIDIGTSASFLVKRRARAKDILLNPSYFSENAALYADHVAKSGQSSIKKIVDALKRAQGWPLPLIIERREINGIQLSDDEIALLKRLAEDGAVKPPSIIVPGRDEAHFIFTPTPTAVGITPIRREIYEKALAIVSAIRLGQLLPGKYAIRYPLALIRKLRSELKLNATSDYNNQYRNLVHMRIATLEKTSGSFYQLKIVDNPENREALDIAYDLISDGTTGPETTIDRDAVSAMTAGRDFNESLIASRSLRERKSVGPSLERMEELDRLLLAGRT